MKVDNPNTPDRSEQLDTRVKRQSDLHELSVADITEADLADCITHDLAIAFTDEHDYPLVFEARIEDIQLLVWELASRYIIQVSDAHIIQTFVMDSQDETKKYMHGIDAQLNGNLISINEWTIETNQMGYDTTRERVPCEESNENSSSKKTTLDEFSG